MKPWLWLVLIVPAGFAVGHYQQTPSLSADTPAWKGPVPQYPGSRLVRAASCAAAACHNANFTHGLAGSEFTHWMTRDSHAKAYEVLFEFKAIDIQHRLRASAKAHQDRRCLKCHVHPDYDGFVEDAIPYFKTDGVSCESCHGPAKGWLSAHSQKAWKFLSPAQKLAHGMNDTQSPLGRAQTCVKCHVGAAGMEVDHELIAAGHPRLHFEFAAFHAMMPHHWHNAKDRDPNNPRRGGPDFEARAWVMGQLATAQASLELLVHRTDDKHVNWPEFAEHDCFACHHNLQSASWRQKMGYGKRKPGALPWGSYVALTPRALETLDADDPQMLRLIERIQQSFDTGKPDRKAIHADARLAAALLQLRSASLTHKTIDSNRLEQLYDSLLKSDGPKATSGWDQVTQIQLGLASLHITRQDMRLPSLADGLFNRLIYPPLDFPKNYQNSRAFEPRSVRNRLGGPNRISR